MSHQFFEDLILSTDELTIQESTILQEHLEECSACARLAEDFNAIETQLRSASMIDPAPHFVNRWEARLETENKRSIQKQNRTMIFLTWGAAFIFLCALIYLAWPLLETPKVVILTYLYQLLGVFSLVNTSQNLSTAVFDGLSGGIPIFYLILIVGAFTEIGVIWVVSFRYLTNPRRVTR